MVGKSDRIVPEKLASSCVGVLANRIAWSYFLSTETKANRTNKLHIGFEHDKKQNTTVQ